MKIKHFAILLFTLIILLVVLALPRLTAVLQPVSPAPASLVGEGCNSYLGTTDFYLCRERQNACGNEGYYIGYADKYINRFVQETRPLMTAAGQDWIDCTLLCLQEHVNQNIPEDAPCDQVLESAISSHPSCYLSCGICSLPPGDMDHIQNTIDGTDLDLDEVLPVGLTCLGGERTPLATRGFQLECVIREGGCPHLYSSSEPPTAGKVAALNEQCRQETGYTGEDVTPTEAECTGWMNSLLSIVESRGLATTTGTWHGEYFANARLEGAPALVREEKEIRFDRETNLLPPEPIDAANFSARWTRTLNLLPGDYVYVISTNGRIRLWINDKLVLDKWDTPHVETVTGEIELPGGSTPIRLEYSQDRESAAIDFVWMQIPAFLPVQE